MRTPDRTLGDPIVMGAIAALGLKPNDLPWNEEVEVEVHATPFLPGLHIYENGAASMSWYREAGMVRYALDDEGGIMTVERQETPDTLLAALVGRTLDALVDVPGAREMRIVAAVNSSSFTGDPLATRAQVERVDADHATT